LEVIGLFFGFQGEITPIQHKKQLQYHMILPRKLSSNLSEVA